MDQQVVVVTGAGRGVGRAVARAFVAQGATLALNDITPINLDLTLRQIEQKGGQAKDYIADISKAMPAQIMLDQILADWGRVDVLVNCASARPQARILDFDEWDWRRSLDVNLHGAFLLTQMAARLMQARGGVIIHVVRAQPKKPYSGESAWAASQAAVAGFVSVAAQELAQYNIQVHVVPSAEQSPAPPEQLNSTEEIRYASTVDLILFLSSRASAGLKGLGMDGTLDDTDDPAEKTGEI